MALRLHSTFGALVAVQAIHSVEECWGRLWESYPPAGFVLGNAVLVLFGVGCYLWPLRRAP